MDIMLMAAIGLIIAVLAAIFFVFGAVKSIKNDSLLGAEKLKADVTQAVNNSISTMSQLLSETQKNASQVQEERLNEMAKKMDKSIEENDKKLEKIQITVDEKLQKTLDGVSNRMEKLVDENNKQLEKIQDTVDEKLQKTLENRISKSFQLVSERLEQVYKGLGEMQNLATGVGDLKKVLSNVKNRGILGEVQLGAILKDILAPSQYEENVPTRPRASERVEFAVKLPGRNEESIYLPIDAKFPGDTYSNLIDAYEKGDRDDVALKQKELISAIKKAASDISKKYINPPYTTDFAVMFLPFEGLYAEVVRLGMVEELQRMYKVNIAGPSTMASMLNSLHMGFKTLAIQKHSSMVWKVLADAKVEFEKFEDIISKTQEKINQANMELDKLVGVRTRQINRVLRDIEQPTGYEDELTLPMDE